MTGHVRFGVDRLAEGIALAGGIASRVALATNDAARSARDPRVPSRVLLLQAGLRLVRLFSPEHGIRADAPDGAPLDDARDALTGLPITSLYGGRFAPSPAELHGIDAVLFDVPDVGARCYTYAWTLTHLLDACADAGIPCWVLDRPNPLGGAVEGPLLEERWFSFIGRHAIPLRHGLTLGELALLWQRERNPAAEVRVVTGEGWQRMQLWPDLGLPFVPTSPAIARFDAALLYPGLVLFEATNLSIARGTPLAFRAFGAPWLHPDAFRDVLPELPGVRCDAVTFTPATGPHAGQACHGLQLVVLEPVAVRPVALGITLLAAVHATHRENFSWARYPTAANPSGEGHLERLVGTEAVRALVESGSIPTAEELARNTATPGWAARCRAISLYG